MNEAVLPDPTAIGDWCAVVYSGMNGFAPVRLLAEKGGPQLKARLPFESVDDRLPAALRRHAEMAAATGAALFAVPGTVASRGRARADDIGQIATIFVDLDTGDIADKVRHLVEHLGASTLMVASGGRTEAGQARVQLYWRLTEPVPHEQVAQVCRVRRMLAEKVGGDTAFGSAHQPVRVAGSVYGKHGVRRPVTILARSELEADLAAFTEAAMAMPPIAGCQTPKPARPKLQTMQIHEGGVDGITRFQALSSIIGTNIRRMRDGRCTLEEAWQATFAFNALQLVPPFPETKVRDEFEALLRRDAQNAGASDLRTEAPEASEDALAELFRLRHGDHWRYVAHWGCWLTWDGQRWRRDETALHRAVGPRPRVDNAMVKALARAFQWQRMLDEGVCATIEELARREKVIGAR